MIFGLAAALALLGSTSLRAAGPDLDFTVPSSNPGAAISYAGGANPLVGTGITITQVEGDSTPANNLVVQAITGGLLNFTTGNLTGSTATSWSFGAGPAGALTITGGIAGLGIAAGSTLLSGTIQSATVTSGGGNNFEVAISLFSNTVNSTLAAFYGLQGGSFPWSGNFNIGFQTSSAATPPGAFSTSPSGAVKSGDVITTPVPEPSTMAIAGLGAIGFIGFGLRRRLQK
jgi:hypothetical protein